MTDIDEALAKYAPGDPSMKPDVLTQIKEIEEERKKMATAQQPPGGSFMINEPGKPPRPITQQEIVDIMNRQTEEIKGLNEKNQAMETMVAQLQKKIASMHAATAAATAAAAVAVPAVAVPPVPSAPVPNSFVDTLLKRIEELERQLNDKKQPTIKTNTPILKSKSIPEIQVSI
jgi:uncharacterized phage infection (PIP) family protein YhgE